MLAKTIIAGAGLGVHTPLAIPRRTRRRRCESNTAVHPHSPLRPTTKHAESREDVIIPTTDSLGP